MADRRAAAADAVRPTSVSTVRSAGQTATKYDADLQTVPDGPVAMASSAHCDLASAAFVQLLVSEFQRGRDDVVRDGIAKALSLPGDVNEEETLVGENVDLASSAIVDAYTNALSFSAQHSFTVLQTQQLLLLLADTLELLVGEGDEAAAQQSSPAAASPPQQQPQQHPLNAILYHFSRKLTRMCAATEMTVDEQSVVVETRTEERVDPAAMAAYEAKQAKAKKGQVIEPPPTTSVEVSEEKEVFERKTIVVGPYFSPTDMALVVSFFDRTVFQHWQLFRMVLTAPRHVVREDQLVFIDDVPSFLPPLSVADPLSSYDAAQERLAIENEVAAAFDAVSTEEAKVWADLTAEADENAAAVRARDEADRQQDRDGAMSAAEFEHAKQVLDKAVSATVHKKSTTSSLLKRIERVEAAAANGIPPPKDGQGGPAASPAASPTNAAASRKGR